MKKTILYCITLSEMGGAQKQVFSLIKGCHSDYNIILACAPGGELIDWVRHLDNNIQVHELPYMKRNISPLNDIKTLIDLIKLLKLCRVDIIHCHSSKAGLIGRIAAWLAGVPVRMFTVHGWSINDNQRPFVQFCLKILEKFAGLLSTHIVCVSKADFKSGLNWDLAPKDKLYMIHNGVQFDFKSPYLRDHLGLSKDDFILGTVARVSKQKNPQRSIELFKNIYKKYDKLFFVWIGDGPQIDECKYMVSKYGLKSRFLFLGNRGDVDRLIGDFNLFSLLSDWEGLPISIIEAMLSGLPIIATNVGGVSELVLNNQNGYLIEKDNLEMMQLKVDYLINNKDTLLRFGLESQRIAKQNFNESTMILKYKEVYHNALSKL